MSGGRAPAKAGKDAAGSSKKSKESAATLADQKAAAEQRAARSASRSKPESDVLKEAAAAGSRQPQRGDGEAESDSSPIKRRNSRVTKGKDGSLDSESDEDDEMKVAGATCVAGKAKLSKRANITPQVFKIQY